MWFEPDLLPGYAWSFPLPGGRANVGFGIQRGGKVARVQDMAGIWRELLDRPHVRAVLGDDAEPEAPHRAWPIPARIDEAVLTGRRTLFVGDAAAATDPLTGEGIGQALLTGVLAAEAIAAAGPDPAAVTAAYRRRRRPRWWPTTACRCCSSGRSATARASGPGCGWRAPPGWTRRNFARWLFEDYPRAAGGHAAPLAPRDVHAATARTAARADGRSTAPDRRLDVRPGFTLPPHADVNLA